jgi:hypothetical protein
MSPRRRVACGEWFIEHANAAFPSGGSVDGRPSFELFASGPLAAATAFFMRRFDEAPEIAPGIRSWVTVELPLFPPIAFYAAAVGDHIELLDFTEEDPDAYWAEFGDDPS